MAQKLSQQQLQLYKAIQEILWNDWDPLVLNQYNDWPTNEYDDYAAIAFSLKMQGASVETIAQKLDEIETQKMGQESRLEKSKLVAEKIFNL